MSPRPRRVIETHHLQAYDERAGRLVSLSVAAVHLGAATGPAVEMGGFTLSTDAALLLADSLKILATRADPECLRRLNEPAWDLGQLRRAINDEDIGA